ncbi:MAG: zf-HC2 domain-containing protein [Planctomycetes bacterium]|nr:zf-HC2 domain-containing protein [Planctomycetota bacterium]
MSAAHKVGCRAWRGRLLLHVDAELPAVERTIFESHLEGCTLCRDALEFHLKVEELLHRSCGLEPDAGFEDRMAAGVLSRIDAAAREAKPLVASRARTARSWRFYAAAAAAACLALLLARGPGPALLEPLPEHGAASNGRAPARAGETVLRADAVVPARLDATRKAVYDALFQAGRTADYRAEFELRTAALAAEDWPIEGIVVAAIKAADADFAAAAIRGAAELSLSAALPALREAALRAETAPAALVALGQLAGDKEVARLERHLADAVLAGAAAAGLARSGSARGARALGNALDRPEIRDLALAALFDMGNVGVGELLRRRAGGDLFAAEALAARNLPSSGQVLELLSTSADPEVLEAALPCAHECGTRALSALRGLVAVPRVRRAALDAVVRIGGAAALNTLLNADACAGLPAGGAIEAAARADVRLAIVRVLRAAPDAADLTRSAARGPWGECLIATLARANGVVQDCLAAVFADSECRPARRAAAALALAEAGALDGPRALAAVCETALLDEDAAALILCAAARAGTSAEHAALLAPLSRATAEPLLERAGVIAARWKNDGIPPLPCEQARLSKLLAQALPRL